MEGEPAHHRARFVVLQSRRFQSRVMTDCVRNELRLAALPRYRRLACIVALNAHKKPVPFVGLGQRAHSAVDLIT